MIEYLHLTNFRKHEDLEVEFGPGLQLIKGSNEAGKSTIIQAIVYVLFGVRAAGAPLSELVTWGKPESSLRVEIKFSHNGQTYLAYRSKSGAELSGPGLLVSGQTEVVRFVENLFQVSADTAAKLNLAKQGKLSGALAEGPAGAVQLIETLADFSLFETLIDRIQSRLPCGNTAAVEASIQRDLQVQRPADLPADLGAGLNGLRVAEKQAVQGLEEISLALAELDVDSANQYLTQGLKLEQEIQTFRKLLADDSAALSNLQKHWPKPPDDSREFLVERLEKQKARSTWARAKLIHQGVVEALAKEPDVFGHLPITKSAVEAQLALAEKARDEAIAKKEQLTSQLATLTGKEISGTCQWCARDLSDVPEVIEQQQRVAAQKLELQKQLDQVTTHLSHELTNIQACMTALEFVRDLLFRVKGLEQYIEVSIDWPPIFVWVGGQDPMSDNISYESLLKEHDQQLAKISAAESQKKMLEDSMARSSERIKTQLKLLNSLPISDAKDTLEIAKALQDQKAPLQARHSKLQAAIAELSAEMATKTNEYKFAMQFWEEAQMRIRDLEDNLAAMQLHNRLIKRLREARPEVAKRLWSIVMASISHYFSQIRGTQSVVTRSDTGFLVDGHPVSSLSGSTLDSLGLAVRWALSQTFIPNLRFMLMDEPAAGMDKAREATMLGLLSTCGLEQIIMVTHSDQADSFANEVIQL